ncbi:MAG: conjugal transfer protein TraJ [Rhodospirillales bacterium]
MATNRKLIKVYGTDEEKARIAEVAAQTKLSVSQFLLRLGVGYPIPNPQDFAAWESISDLLKVNADLARLGNLLKLAIDERPEDTAAFAKLIDSIQTTQNDIKSCVIEIRNAVKPARK